MTNVRIYNADREMLTAFKNSSIIVTVAVPNYSVGTFASSPEAALNWINTNVKPFASSRKRVAASGPRRVHTSVCDAEYSCVASGAQPQHQSDNTPRLRRHRLSPIGGKVPETRRHETYPPISQGKEFCFHVERLPILRLHT